MYGPRLTADIIDNLVVKNVLRCGTQNFLSINFMTFGQKKKKIPAMQ
jgi:hypothetical protein